MHFLIKFILFFNESRQLDPVLGAYIGTVQRKGLQRVNGAEGPSEMTLSAGVGLPISNHNSSRSVVNINLQWLRRHPASSSLISENYFLVNVGLTFNENWFMKFKIQ